MSKYDEVLRPFLAMMEKELHANSNKGDRPGWLQMDSKTAILEVFYHMGKLHQAVHRGEAEAIKEYSADVANMCMMLVDVCGLLPIDYQPAPVSVSPDGFMLVERSIWTEEQVESAAKCIAMLKDVPGMTDRDLALAAMDAGQCHAPDITLIDLPASTRSRS